MSSHDPETGCGIMMLLGALGLIALLALSIFLAPAIYQLLQP